jgi:hypothetical protein
VTRCKEIISPARSLDTVHQGKPSVKSSEAKNSPNQALILPRVTCTKEKLKGALYGPATSA